MVKNLQAPWDFFFQMTHSGVIDVAMYYDRLVRTPDGSWRFTERRYRYVWVSSADLGGRSIPTLASKYRPWWRSADFGGS